MAMTSSVGAAEHVGMRASALSAIGVGRRRMRSAVATASVIANGKGRGHRAEGAVIGLVDLEPEPAVLGERAERAVGQGQHRHAAPMRRGGDLDGRSPHRARS